MASGNYETRILGTYLNDGSKITSEGNFSAPKDVDENLIPIINSLMDTNASSVYFKEPGSGRKIFLDRENNKTKGGSKRNTLFNNSFTNVSPYIEVPLGALACGSFKFVLNLTNDYIRCIDGAGLTNVYGPVSHSHLKRFEGCVIVYEIISINIETCIDALIYPKQLMRFAGKSMPMIHASKIFQECERAMSDFGITNIANRKPEEIRDILGVNSLKIAVMTVINPTAMDDVFMNDYVINIKENGAQVMKQHTNQINKVLDKVATRQADDITCKEGNKGLYQIFIVDNKTKLSERYTKVGHLTTLIPQVKDVDKEDGLYIHIPNYEAAEGRTFIPLDEIAGLDYIYQSVEECEQGFNVREVAKKQDEDTIHIRKMEAETHRLSLEMEKNRQAEVMAMMDAQKREIEAMIKVLDNKISINNQFTDKSFDDYKRHNDYSFKTKSNEQDFDLTNHKHALEKQKMEMDERIAQYKYGIAAIGMIGAGYALWKKLS